MIAFLGLVFAAIANVSLFLFFLDMLAVTHVYNSAASMKFFMGMFCCLWIFCLILIIKLARSRKLSATQAILYTIGWLYAPTLVFPLALLKFEERNWMRKISLSLLVFSIIVILTYPTAVFTKAWNFPSVEIKKSKNPMENLSIDDPYHMTLDTMDHICDYLAKHKDVNHPVELKSIQSWVLGIRDLYSQSLFALRYVGVPSSETWVLQSVGPDRELEPLSPEMILYDPTNGTASRGDIVKTPLPSYPSNLDALILRASTNE